MKMKDEKFPLSIKRGSSVVKVAREVKPTGGIYYRVVFYKGGKRCSLSFTELDKAKLEAEAKAAQLSRGDLDALQVTGQDRHIYGRALEAVRSLGVPLDAAALEYAEARTTLGGFSLAEAARFYMRHHGAGIRVKLVADAVAEMIEAKTKNGASAVYLADLRYRLGGLADAFHCNVNAITQDDLRAYLDALTFAPRGYNNQLGALGTFFTYAQSREWLSKDVDLLAGIERRKAKSVPVEIFTPAEMAELLAHCTPELRPCLALAAFAGLRQEEILRIDWQEVDKTPGFVLVAADKAKTAARRLVPIAGNLARWLATCERSSGRVCPLGKSGFSKALAATVRRINAARKPSQRRFRWKTNALRHSFISYRLADINDMSKVAMEAGNSPQMINQHYRELCTPADAQAWFAIAPGEAVNVIPMRAAK